MQYHLWIPLAHLFPGETEEDFNETLDVIEKAGYDNAFTFIYSKRTGTPAASMEDQIPEEIVKERFDRLLNKVKEISAKKAAKYVGKTVYVLAEIGRASCRERV